MDLSKLLFWKQTPVQEKSGGASQQITNANIDNFVIKAVGQIDDSVAGDFAPAEYELEEIKAAAGADSYVKLAIRKYSELIFKAGYNIVGANDDAANYIESRLRLMSFMTKTPFDVLLQGVADDLVMYSNAFLVKSRIDNANIGGLQVKGVLDPKPVGGYFRVDPYTMEIKRDKNGQVKGYQQTIGSKEKKYKDIDVIHFYIDKEAGASFGRPRIEAALSDVRLLRKIEGDVLKIIYRHSKPITQMKIGLPETGFMATDQEIRDAKAEVEQLTDDGIIITNERTDFKIIGAEGQVLNANSYLEYFEKRVFSALSLSSAMVGRGGAKQDADSMEEQVHNAVKYYQKTLKIFIENFIFTELLLEGGYNPIMNEEDIVNFKFNEINLETKVKMETHAVNKFQGNAIDFEEMRKEIGLKGESVDEARLFANMIKKQNELEIMQAQSELSGNATKSKKQDDGKNNAIKDNIEPQNQHGRTTSKVKEALNLNESLKYKTKENSEKVKNFNKNFNVVYKKYIAMSNKVGDACDNHAKILTLAKEDFNRLLINIAESEAKKGYEEAMLNVGKEDLSNDYLMLSNVLVKKQKVFVDNLFADLSQKVSEAKDSKEIKKAFSSLEYRLEFLKENIIAKYYYHTYFKTCEKLNIDKILIQEKIGNEVSDIVFNIKDFKLRDIPACYANLRIRSERKVGEHRECL